VRLSHKIVHLDLAPFSENVENHWFICAGAAGMPWLRDLRVGIDRPCCARYVQSCRNTCLWDY